MNKWISIKDRLPEDNSRRIIYCYSSDKNKNVVDFAYYEDSHWFSIWDSELIEDHYWTVTHWMSLPEPPENTNAD